MIRPGSNMRHAVLAFVAGVALLAFSLVTDSIPGGDDAYRHARFAARWIANPGDAMSDPWRLLWLWDKPVDVWFGYHLLLAPLTLVFDPILAAKVLAGIVWAALAWVILKLLDDVGAAWTPAWMVLALCGSGTFLYRATLARPFLFSLMLMLLATHLAFRKRRVGVAIVSAVHALSYSMFFLVALPVGAWWAVKRDRESSVLLACSAAGILAGLALNPFFPENVRFNVAVALMPLTAGSHPDLNIGGELRPLSVWWLVLAVPVLAVWLASLAGVVRARRLNARASAVLLVSLVTLALSIRVSRTFDQFVPFAVLFAAAVLSAWIVENRRDARWAFGILLAFCTLNVVPAWRTAAAAPSVFEFREACAAIAARSGDAIVFNTQWEHYYFLYYWNPRSRYVNGIEPTLMFRAAPDRYWLWRHIADDQTSTCGAPECGATDLRPAGDAIATEFGASWVVASSRRNPKLIEYLSKHRGFRRVYGNNTVAVFEAYSHGLR